MEIDLFFAISAKNPVGNIVTEELIAAKNEFRPLHWWQMEANLVNRKYFIVQNYSPMLYSRQKLSTVQRQPIWGPVVMQISPFSDIHQSILNLCDKGEPVNFFDLRKYIWKDMGQHSWIDLCIRPDPARVIATLSIEPIQVA